MKTYQKIIMIVILIAILTVIGFICYGFFQKMTYKSNNPIATIEVEGFGTIKVELYPDQAPNTVANFIALANSGLYNGTTFHRTIPDFMIQGGDVNGDGTGSPTLSYVNTSIEKDSDGDKEYAIKGEFFANNFKNNKIKFDKGVIAMARSDYSSLGSKYTTAGYNSAGSQFFITTEESSSLDGLYAAFGRVIEGMDVVTAIGNVEVVTRESSEEGADKPVNPPVITSITIDTFGIDYGKPETVEPFDYNEILQQYYSSNGY